MRIHAVGAQSTKRRNMRASKSRLALVLLLIGREGSPRVFLANYKRSNANGNHEIISDALLKTMIKWAQKVIRKISCNFFEKNLKRTPTKGQHHRVAGTNAVPFSRDKCNTFYIQSGKLAARSEN